MTWATLRVDRSPTLKRFAADGLFVAYSNLKTSQTASHVFNMMLRYHS